MLLVLGALVLAGVGIGIALKMRKM